MSSHSVVDDAVNNEAIYALDMRWMQRALEVASWSLKTGDVPIGAVVVRGDEEVAVGWNTREATHDPCGHAEINALRAASQVSRQWRLDDCTLYVSLEPCAMCAGALVLARIKRCVFAASDPKAGFLGSLGNLGADPRLNHRFPVVSGVLAQEASEQIRSFFRSLRQQR